jgi:signal peptidase II
LSQAGQRQSITRADGLLGFLPWVLVPALVVVLDQLLKLIFVRWIGPDADQHTIELVGTFIAFDYVENTGAAFGIMTSATSTLAAVSLLISAGGLYMMWREHRSEPLAALAIGLVVGGAVGNVIDRIFRGYVVDFIGVGGFPRFNLADSCITIGVLLLLAAMIRESRHQPTRTPQEGMPLVDD